MNSPKYINVSHRFIFVLILFSSIFSQDIFAAKDLESCQSEFKKFAANRVTKGWIAVDDVLDFVNSEGLQGFRSANAYTCDSCGQTNVSKTQANKLTQCEGCGNKFDGHILVHDTYLNGRKVVHLDGIMFKVNGRWISQSSSSRPLLM